MKPKPSIALVGRPNVGKSRLFNRIARQRISIVHDQPGVTRDIVTTELENGYILMDTGGLGLQSKSAGQEVIAAATDEQVEFALMAADLILMVVDGMEGPTFHDKEIALKLRRFNKPVFLLINKMDRPQHEDQADDFSGLALERMFYVSAEHDRGMEHVYKAMHDLLGEVEESAPAADAAKPIKLCFAGKPNVGKSSITNALLNAKRVIVSDVPGTTRDSVEIDLVRKKEGKPDEHFCLIDTAGVRNKSKVNTSLDYFSTLRTHQGIEESDVVFLVIDALQGVGKLEKNLGGKILEQGKCLVILVNKWDLAQKQFAEDPPEAFATLKEFQEAFVKAIKKELFFLPSSPIHFMSAMEGFAVENVLDLALRMYQKSHQTLPTGPLNRLVGELVNRQVPRYVGAKRFKVYYTVQVGTHPIKVRLFCNRHGKLEDSYHRYLENGFQKTFDLEGCPMRFEIMGKTSEEVHERLANKSGVRADSSGTSDDSSGKPERKNFRANSKANSKTQGKNPSKPSSKTHDRGKGGKGSAPRKGSAGGKGVLGKAKAKRKR